MKRIWSTVAGCAMLAIGAWTVLAFGQVQDFAAPLITERITATVLAKTKDTLVVQPSRTAQAQSRGAESTVSTQALRLFAMGAFPEQEIAVGDEVSLCLQLHPQGGETLLECAVVSSGNFVDEALAAAAEKLLP